MGSDPTNKLTPHDAPGAVQPPAARRPGGTGVRRRSDRRVWIIPHRDGWYLVQRGRSRYLVRDHPQSFAAGLLGWPGFDRPTRTLCELAQELARHAA